MISQLIDLIWCCLTPIVLAQSMPNPSAAKQFFPNSSAIAQASSELEANDNAGFYIPKDLGSRKGTKPSTSRRKNRHHTRAWYLPRLALGGGLNVPEILPLEGWIFFGKYFGFRGFYTPELPFKIRVEMPADVISTKKGVGVANPDFTINFKGRYGPHFGMEAILFPFGGSFFIGAGAAERSMRLKGSAKSAILICSLIEVAKEPPCPDPEATLHPETKLQVKADAWTKALLIRGMTGFFWDISSWGYFSFQAGATKPTQVQRRVKMDTSLDFPTSDGADDDVTGALAQVKQSREEDLEKKAIKEMRPVDTKLLPIIAISAGVRF